MTLRHIWTKICGTTNLEDATLAWQLGADAIGFVFVEQSLRRVTVPQVREIVDALARPIERIGVIQNLPLEDAISTFEHAGLSGLQLHGDEAPEYVRDLRHRLPHIRIIKGLHVQSPATLQDALALYEHSGADAVLLDSHVPGQSGGTGTRFDWSAAAFTLERSGTKLPIIIAGGLTPENVREAIHTFHPFGVDVVSGVERTKGKKNPDKLRAFIDATRSAYRKAQV
jgi:phosphoribosylanthranilate isomerase